MATLAQAMLRDALDAFVKRDVALAQSVLDRDDSLDALKTQIFRELLTYMLQNPATIEGSLELILVSRHLERDRRPRHEHRRGHHLRRVRRDVGTPAPQNPA